MLRLLLACACVVAILVCVLVVDYVHCMLSSGMLDGDACDNGAAVSRSTFAPGISEPVQRPRHAVLLAGDRLHALRLTGVSLRRFVLDQLGDDVDVFLVGTPMSDADVLFVRELFASRLVRLVMRQQMPDEALTQTFYRGGGNNRTTNKTHFWEHKCVGGMGGLHCMWWLQEAYRLAQAHENATGIPYAWIHSLRPDLEWLAPMPPMAMLNSTRLFMATRQCWGGVPGGIIHCPRHLCGFYLELFDCMSSGVCTDLMTRHGHESCVPVVERDIMFLLRYANMPLGYYNNVANLICLPRLCAAGKCTAPHLCRDNARFKYRGYDHYYEAELALLNARIVHRVGWRRQYREWRLIHDDSSLWPVPQVEAQDHYLETHPVLKAELFSQT